MTNKNRSGGAKLPKGAYRLPQGGYVTESRHIIGDKRYVLRAVQREHLDSAQLAKLFLRLAVEISEREWKQKPRER